MKRHITITEMANILCVEDENELHTGVAAELREIGLNAIDAANGQQGLELISGNQNTGNSTVDRVTKLPTEKTLHLAHPMMSASKDKLFPHCAMMVDIANMSETNSLFGNAAGNQLYHRIGQRLQGMMERFFPCSKNGDVNYLIARMPVGDFGILIFGEVDQNGIECVAKELARAVAEPFTEDPLHNFSASVRIGAYEGRTNDVADTLKGAKRAIRDAKRKGDNLVLHFKHAAQMTDGKFASSDLKAEIPRALRSGELELYYQPRIHTSSASNVECVEALIRWNHPDLGLVGPDHFIPDAEDSGLIVTIGDWALKEACTQGKR